MKVKIVSERCTIGDAGKTVEVTEEVGRALIKGRHVVPVKPKKKTVKKSAKKRVS
jgi:hypothetical protein